MFQQYVLPMTGTFVEPRRYNAIYLFEMSVLFETGEMNTYVYDGGGLYRRKYV